jgi:hypothetical protein
MGRPPAALLAAALVLACGGQVAGISTRELEASAVACSLPGVALQVLALLAINAPVATESATMAELVRRFPRATRSFRREILSIDEVAERLQITD